MGSMWFDEIRFQVFSDDHLPPHAHGHYGSTSVVVEFEDSEAIGIQDGSILTPERKAT